MKIFEFLRDLLKLVQKDRKLLLGLIIFTACIEVLILVRPWLFLQLLTQVENLQLEMWHLIVFVVGIMGSSLLYGAAGVIRVRINRRISFNAANTIRERFFSHLLKLPYNYFLTHQAGGQANSYLNDIDDIDRSATQLVEVGLRAMFSITIIGAVLFYWNPEIALLASIFLPVTVVLQRRLRKKVQSSSRNKVDLRESLNADVSEAVQNINVVKSFNLADTFLSRLNHISQHFRFNDVILETTQSGLRSGAAIILVFTQFAFFAYAAVMVIDGELAIAEFLTQIMLLNMLITPLNQILDFYNNLVQSHSALHRIEETMNLPQEGSNYDRSQQDIPTDHGISVKFEDLKFRYREEVPLLEGIDLDIKAGQTVAIVGPSGSGKTTILQLLIGLFEDYQGKISINGIDLHSCLLSDLRKVSGVVFQEQLLLSDSIRNNLLVGADEPESITDDDFWRALKMAHADEFVEQMPDGLETAVGINGQQLSGGQRQRLAIARAILKNPPLLLMDEATSALDSISEHHIQEALQNLLKERTSIVIAHRLSTIVDADQIIVLENGKIQEAGNHASLLEANGIYRKLYDAQVEGFLNWDDLNNTNGNTKIGRQS